jgi:hypothetical protein
MPLVNADIFATLCAAEKSPEKYATGKERQSLRAAFDLASSQITKKVFGFEAETRMMRRERINSEQVTSSEYSDLIAALKKALAAADPLDTTGGYDDDNKAAVKFIRNALAPLLKAIEPFQ